MNFSFITDWLKNYNIRELFLWIQTTAVHPANQLFQIRFELLLYLLFSIPPEKFRNKDLKRDQFANFIEDFDKKFSHRFHMVEDWKPFNQLKLIPYLLNRRKYYFFYGNLERPYEFVRQFENLFLIDVSIKSINFAPFGKNLKNPFGDLLTEAITLHLRFPYSVVCMLFVFPVAADKDITKGRALSTFQRATRLFATVSGRRDYTDPGEKFENVTMVLFQPIKEKGPKSWVRLFDAQSRKEISEKKYFTLLRQIYNTRNPHALVGEEELETGETSEDFKERRKHHG